MPATCARHGEASLPTVAQIRPAARRLRLLSSVSAWAPVNEVEAIEFGPAGQAERGRSDLHIGVAGARFRAAGPRGCDSRPCRPGPATLLMPVARWKPTAPARLATPVAIASDALARKSRTSRPRRSRRSPATSSIAIDRDHAADRLRSPTARIADRGRPRSATRGRHSGSRTGACRPRPGRRS